MNNNSLIQVQVQDYIQTPQQKTHRKLISKKIQPFMKAYSLKPELFEIKGKQIVFKNNNSTNLSNLNKTMFSTLHPMKQQVQRKVMPQKSDFVQKTIVSLHDFQVLPLTTKYANLFEEIQKSEISQIYSDQRTQKLSVFESNSDEQQIKNKNYQRYSLKKGILELEKIKQTKIDELKNLQNKIDQVKTLGQNNTSQMTTQNKRNPTQREIKNKAVTKIQAYIKKWIQQKKYKKWKNRKLEKLKKIIFIQKWWRFLQKLWKRRDKFELCHYNKKVKLIDEYPFILLSNYSYYLKRIRILLVERKGKIKQDFRFYINHIDCQAILNEEITKDSYEFNILIDLITNSIINQIIFKNKQIKIDLESKNIVHIPRLMLYIEIQIHQILGNKYQVIIFQQQNQFIENQQFTEDQEFIENQELKTQQQQELEEVNDYIDQQIINQKENVEYLEQTKEVKKEEQEINQFEGNDDKAIQIINQNLDDFEVKTESIENQQNQNFENVQSKLDQVQIITYDDEKIEQSNSQPNQVIKDLIQEYQYDNEEIKQINKFDIQEKKDDELIIDYLKQEKSFEKSNSLENSKIEEEKEQNLYEIQLVQNIINNNQSIDIHEQQQQSFEKINDDQILQEEKNQQIKQFDQYAYVQTNYQNDNISQNGEKFDQKEVIHIQFSKDLQQENDSQEDQKEINIQQQIQIIQGIGNQQIIEISQEIQKNEKNNVKFEGDQQFQNDNVENLQEIQSEEQITICETQNYQPIEEDDPSQFNILIQNQQYQNKQDNQYQNNILNDNKDDLENKQISESIELREQNLNNHTLTQQIQGEDEFQEKSYSRQSQINVEESKINKFEFSMELNVPKEEFETSQQLNVVLEKQDSLKHSQEIFQEQQPNSITTLVIDGIEIDVFELNQELQFKDKQNFLVQCDFQISMSSLTTLDYIQKYLSIYIMKNHIRCLKVEYILKIQSFVKKFIFVKSAILTFKQELILIGLYKSCISMQILIFKNDKLEQKLLMKSLSKNQKAGLQKQFLSICPQFIQFKGLDEEDIIRILEKLGCKN